MSEQPAPGEGDLGVDLSAEEALFCLEGIACGYNESWTPQVGARRSALTGTAAEDLARRLAKRAGIAEEEAAAAGCFGWRRGA